MPGHLLSVSTVSGWLSPQRGHNAGNVFSWSAVRPAVRGELSTTSDFAMRVTCRTDHVVECRTLSIIRAKLKRSKQGERTYRESLGVLTSSVTCLRMVSLKWRLAEQGLSGSNDFCPPQGPAGLGPALLPHGRERERQCVGGHLRRPSTYTESGMT